MERIWARRGYLGAHRKPEVGISSAVYAHSMVISVFNALTFVSYLVIAH